MAATTAPSTAPWTELFEGRDGSRHLDRLRRIGLRITGCNDLASDAVQEAVIGLWRLRDDLPDDFAAWLGHAVVHRSLHLRRSALRRRRHEAIA
ncbi:MAG TPA: sigma factor, partial [Planctomycetota bacterium]|nr:sigma factor [Planctomycetota bacterium]